MVAIAIAFQVAFFDEGLQVLRHTVRRAEAKFFDKFAIRWPNRTIPHVLTDVVQYLALLIRKLFSVDHDGIDFGFHT